MNTRFLSRITATRTLIFAILSIIGAVSFWFILQGDEQASRASSITLDAEFTSGDEDRKLARTAPKKQTTGILQSGWTIVSKDTVPAAKLPQYQETFHDAELVQLNPNIWTWQHGERVAFNLPHIASTVEFQIERSEPGLGRSRSYVGHHRDLMKIYPVVVTVGSKSTFAYIASENGNFEMVGNTEFGWLMPTEAMERHVDYSKPDYVLPDTEHKHSQ